MTRNTARTRTEWQTVLQIYCGLVVVDSMRNPGRHLGMNHHWSYDGALSHTV